VILDGGFMDILFIFVYGIVIGSFLNVCIYRIPRNESLSYPPSHCTSCGSRVKWYDLFPVISYLFLKGKCRYCGENISIRYPFIELLTGLIYILIYVNFGFSFEFLKYVILASFLIVVGIIDLDTTDVYTKTTLPGIILGIIFAGYGYYLYGGIWEYILGGALGGGVISVIILLTKGMGWGDAEICLMCGLFLGLKLTVIMLFL
jgi:leader peptidase (prepilin peptidase)/N-methyltransferase